MQTKDGKIVMADEYDAEQIVKKGGKVIDKGKSLFIFNNINMKFSTSRYAPPIIAKNLDELWDIYEEEHTESGPFVEKPDVEWSDLDETIYKITEHTNKKTIKHKESIS